MFDKIYVINLDRDSKRLENIKNQLNREKIQNYERVPGILGKANIPENLKKYINPNLIQFLPKGLIGCGISHVRSWETMVKSGEPSALFLEDDAKLTPGFKETLDSYSKDIPEDFDIIYLGAFIGNSDTKQYTLDYSVMKLLNFGKVNQVVKYSENVFTPALPLAMHGYILSRAYAKKLLQNFEKDKLTYHIDFQILRYNYTAKVFSISPVLITQQDIDIDTSSNANFVFPKSINALLNVKDSSGIPMNYKLSLAHFEFADTPINGYFYLFCSMALLSGILGYNPAYITSIILTLLVIDSVLFGINTHSNINVMVILLFSYIFNLLGRQFRAK